MKRSLALAAATMLGGLCATPALAQDNQGDNSGFYAGVGIGEGGGYLLGRAGYDSVKVEREVNGVEYPDLDINGGSFGFGGGLGFPGRIQLHVG